MLELFGQDGGGRNAPAVRQIGQMIEQPAGRGPSLRANTEGAAPRATEPAQKVGTATMQAADCPGRPENR